jgi:hypothetical protein
MPTPHATDVCFPPQHLFLLPVRRLQRPFPDNEKYFFHLGYGDIHFGFSVENLSVKPHHIVTVLFILSV